MVGNNEGTMFTFTADSETVYVPSDINNDGDPFDVRGRDKTAVLVTNDHDENAEVSFEAATYADKDFENPVTVDEENVNEGESVYMSTDEPFAYLRVVFDYTNIPTEGGEGRVTFQSSN